MAAIVYVRSARPAPHNHSEADQIPVVTDGIEDGAITTAKLADTAVTTAKIADGAVTPAKASAELKSKMYMGDETEVSVTGTTETELKQFLFVQDGPMGTINSFYVQATLKSSSSTATASLKIYIDDETTPRLTLSTTSTDYALQTGYFDVSDLTSGIHTIHIKLASDTATETAYNYLLEFYAR